MYYGATYLLDDKLTLSMNSFLRGYWPQTDIRIHLSDVNGRHFSFLYNSWQLHMWHYVKTGMEQLVIFLKRLET
jgi:hypothetical protein